MRRRTAISVLAALAVAALAPTASAADVSTRYAAPHATDKPILVLLHGGGWAFGSSEQTRPWAEMLNRQGYPVVNVAYRLSCPTVDLEVAAVAAGVPPTTPAVCPAPDKLILDVARQVRWARHHHAALRTSSLDVVLVGFSAGGHLAALLTARGIADAAIGFSAPTTLTAASSELAPYVTALTGCSLSQCADRWLSLSPSTYATTRPMFLAYGQHEAMVPALQGDEMRGDPNVRVVRVARAQHSSASMQGWERRVLPRALTYVESRLGLGI